MPTLNKKNIVFCIYRKSDKTFRINKIKSDKKYEFWFNQNKVRTIFNSCKIYIFLILDYITFTLNPF